MQIKIYVITQFSTDDCTYACNEYCGVYATRDEAEELIKSWNHPFPDDFKIQEEILDL